MIVQFAGKTARLTVANIVIDMFVRNASTLRKTSALNIRKEECNLLTHKK